MTDNMKQPLYFHNARIICPASNYDEIGYLIVSDGVIAERGRGSLNSIPDNATQIDCGGDVICPGLVDMRVQSRDPGAEHLENLSSLLASAAAGGVTSLVTLPGTDPIIDNAAMIDSLYLRAGRISGPNLYAYGAMTKALDGNRLAELGMMAEAGAVGFANTMTSISDALLMRRIMTYAEMLNRPVIHHCADSALSAGTEMHEGETATRLGLIGAPAIAESIILERDLALVELTGVQYHAAHISTAASVEILRRAKDKGLAVTADTAPPYFSLNDIAVSNYDTAYKLNPPLRSETDRLAILEALQDGTIDAIASDHMPVSLDDKMQPFGVASCGASGLETLLPMTLQAVHSGALTLIRALEALTSAPATILDLPGGTLMQGASADIVRINLDSGWVIQAENLHSLCQITPFAGQPVQGQITGCWVAGVATDKDSGESHSEMAG